MCFKNNAQSFKTFIFTTALLIMLLNGVIVVNTESAYPISIKLHIRPNLTTSEINSNQVLVVRDIIKEVNINCEAKCPVEWILEKFRYGKFPDELADMVTFASKREFTNFFNSSSYTFTSQLTLKGGSSKLTGNYTCKCANKNVPVQKSIYVYWEGSSSNYLLQAGEKRTISEIENEYVRIYCGVSKPNFDVSLIHNGDELLPNGNTVRHDIDGFLVHESVLKSSTNEFICKLQDGSNEPSDIAVYNFTSNTSRRHKIILLHGALLTSQTNGLVNYDHNTNTLICCSSEGKHRQVGFYCTSHQACRFRSYQLESGHNANKPNGTCTWYTEGFRASDGGVTFRCAVTRRNGELFEAEAEKIYGLDASSYYSLKEAEEDKANFIGLRINEMKHLLLKGASITFHCTHSTYLFSDGTVFSINYQNGSSIILKSQGANNSQGGNDFKIEDIWTENRGHDDFLKIRVFSMEVESVTCHAPLWNSYEWWDSKLVLTLQNSVSPYFESNEEEIYAKEKDKVELKCTAFAYPAANLTWSYHHPSYLKELAEQIVTQTNQINNSALDPPFLYKTVTVLSFPMNENRIGNYICRANSEVGNAQKTFTLKQKDSTIVNIIIITTVVVIILVAVLGYALRKISLQRKAINFLTKKDIEDFEKGNPAALEELNKNNQYSTNDAHHLLPYNSDYEVPKDRLIVDYGKILGQGTYGIVMQGRLKKMGDEIDVAVKTIKPNEDASHFKVLLCEVKIMAYIGSFPNVVCLVGAYTRNIRNRELLVATEFCEHGNLLDILREGRMNFNNIQNEADYQNIPQSKPHRQLNTMMLLKWAVDVATGMEFLGTKRVIHGDLACRNVLIGSGFVAKVGDFGLSKHLFQYSTYQKKTVQLLPWRWMAYESLTDMVFSLQSDVWAFGVTLWEIFGLGQTPYPGMVWDEVFIKKLQDDFRLPKPAHASTEMYELILSCWVMDPMRRPTFTTLKECLKSLSNNLDK